MAEWNGNPSWTPKEQINGGEQFNADDVLTPDDFNALVENMQYLYEHGGDFEVNPYPIDTVYISFNGVSPASLFGGGWTQLKSKFLLGASNEAILGTNPTYSGSQSGGTETHNHSLESGYAKYNPSITSGTTRIYKVTDQTGGYAVNTSASGADKFSTTINETAYDAIGLGGNTDNVSNMPPYQVVYMWRRIS
jgi:hypothetical protein